MTSTKDWTSNSVSYIKTAGFSNNRQHERQQHDYYATSPLAIELLLNLDNFSNVWECAAGGGHMADVLKEHGVLGKASDKFPQREDIEEEDFLAPTSQNLDFLENGKWDGDIITNPPYKYASEFIKFSLERIPDGRKVAMFLPIRYLAGQSRRKIFEKYPPYKIWVASSRIICAINGEFDTIKSGAVDYCWIIWHKGYQGETKLGWFN